MLSTSVFQAQDSNAVVADIYWPVKQLRRDQSVNRNADAAAFYDAPGHRDATKIC